MTENKEELQVQVPQLIHQDIVNIITNYSETTILNLDLVRTFIQDITLLKAYDVQYIHNQELDEVIALIYDEFNDKNSVAVISFLIGLDFLLGKEENLNQAIYINLSLKIPVQNFLQAFSIFEVLNQSILDLYKDLMKYIFNDKFLDLSEEFQIDILLKIWYHCFQLYHDDNASRLAYNHLKMIFDMAVKKEKTEVAFWLYYFPMNYYNGATISNINEANENFKLEVEKPLEKYIKDVIIPKYNIQPFISNDNEKKEKKKVVFVYPRIKKHSTVNVLYTMMNAIMKSGQEEYEFILYDLFTPELGGSEIDMIYKFQDIGVKYVNLHEEVFGNIEPAYSLLEKCLRIREYLIKENIDIFIGLHTRIEYIFLFTTRVAKEQIYWYHASNEVYDIEGIDKRISHCGSEENSKYDFKHFKIPLDLDRYSVDIEQNEVQKVRELFPKNSFILGTIGRLIKIDSYEYLQVVAKIMKDNPNTIFLACGGGDQESIRKKVELLGIEKRFYFTGHIDPHLYGEVIDLWLESFPLRNGESLIEYYMKDKAFVCLSPIDSDIYIEEKKQFISKEEYVVLIDDLIQELKRVDGFDIKTFIKSSYYDNKPTLAYRTAYDIGMYIDNANKIIRDKELYNNFCLSISALNKYNVLLSYKKQNFFECLK